MSSNNPEAIRRDIERTRADLSDNVNALAENANPANAARRQVDKVKDRAHDLKERVFGDPNDPWDDGAVGGVQAKASGLAEDAAYQVQRTPAKLRRSTQGNPLAAGLIAFGLGALVGGLLPASEAEKDLAQTAKEKAQPVLDEAQAMAKEAAENLRPVAEEAVAGVKDTASTAAGNVKTEATAAKDTVAEQARTATDEVKQDDRNPL
ncbi:MAG: DUF3618 domain-containing protein [Actinomycetes bacterium]